MPENDLFDGKYQTEYKGPVGFEKKSHQTHFPAAGTPLRHSAISDYEWVEIRPLRWKLVRKEKSDGKESENL
jgi:hypothetical protein